MNVVYALTRNLYPYLKMSLNSLLEHNDVEKVYIYAEDDTFPYKLPDCCEVINVSNQRYFWKTSPNMKSIYSYMAMMRITYADKLPVDRVIQLDIDTVVCDSLQPLWEMDLDGTWFAACHEYLGHHNPFNQQKYFNIGVAVFNLDQIRKDGKLKYMISMLNTRWLSCVEQDALNYFGNPEKVVELPIRWNECICTGFTENPAVVHYAGYRDWYNCNHEMKRWEYAAKYLDKGV